MSTFETYTAAREHQAKLQTRLDEARQEYRRQVREYKGAWPYTKPEADREAKLVEYCAPALEKVRLAIAAVEEARVATWAAADAVEDKALMANEYI